MRKSFYMLCEEAYSNISQFDLRLKGNNKIFITMSQIHAVAIQSSKFNICLVKFWCYHLKNVLVFLPVLRAVQCSYISGLQITSLSQIVIISKFHHSFTYVFRYYTTSIFYVSTHWCLCLVAKPCLTLWNPMTAACQTSLSVTVSRFA